MNHPSLLATLLALVIASAGVDPAMAKHAVDATPRPNVLFLFTEE